MVVLALVGEGLAAEGLHDDFQGFLEPVLALHVVDAHGVVGADVAAAAHAKLEPALADLVHRGRFLGNAQGMDQGQHVDRRPNAQLLRSGGNGAENYHLGRMNCPLGSEVGFAQPHGVQAPLIGQVHQLESIAEGRLVGAAARWKVQKDSKVHRDYLLTCFVEVWCPSGNLDCWGN